MTLFRLVYCSRATGPQSLAGLKELLFNAERRNALAGVTGILCYGNGTFCQCLEGPPAAVSDTIARIFRDPRHAGLVLLDGRAVPSRLFPDWGMKLVRYDDLPANLLRCIVADGSDAHGEGVFDPDRVLEMLQAAA